MLNTSTIVWMSWERGLFLLPSFMKRFEASIVNMPVRAWACSFIDDDDAGGIPVP